MRKEADDQQTDDKADDQQTDRADNQQADEVKNNPFYFVYPNGDVALWEVNGFIPTM